MLPDWYYWYRPVSIPPTSTNTGIPVSLLKESTGTSWAIPELNTPPGCWGGAGSRGRSVIPREGIQ